MLISSIKLQLHQFWNVINYSSITFNTQTVPEKAGPKFFFQASKKLESLAQMA
jgi:hypothetical protein